MSATLQTTQVDLSGLLEVLGKNLYSTPTVAIRELIQNAHDACVRRRIEAPDAFTPQIRIQTHPGKRQLVIEDNGAGLTDSEINAHLATIGSGYTRLLRQQTQSEEMIGYFGLGFLSAYVVAERVEVCTTSWQETNKGFRFISNNGERYSIDAIAAMDVGTKVTLELQPDFAELADAGLLRSLLAKYCCLLPVAIHLNEEATAVNHLVAPWQLASTTSLVQRKKQSLQFANVFEQYYEPLCTIAIQPTDDCPVSGLLWIHDSSSYANSDQRNVTVFVRGMYITNDERELLPGWAGFVGCVIETKLLTPTASREDIQKDEVYARVQLHIHRTLVNGLIDIFNNEAETRQRILLRHNERLLGAAISDENLFHALKDVLTVPTSEGDLQLVDIKQRSQDQLRITMEEKGGYEEVLSRALMIPVIQGYRYGAMPFTQYYAEQANLETAILGTHGGNKTLFNEIEVEAKKHQLLQSLLAMDDEQVVTASFKPDYLPLVIIPNEQALLKQRIEEDEASKRISTAALGLARLHTRSIKQEALASIYVNLDCPLIQQLFTLDETRQALTGRMLRSFMLVMGHNQRSGSRHSLSDELRTYTKTLQSLLTSQNG